MISFRIEWLDLVVQEILKSLLQYQSSKASILWHIVFFTVQLSHPYVTTGKISLNYTDLCWQSVYESSPVNSVSLENPDYRTQKRKNLSYDGAQQLCHPLNVTYGSCLKELLGEGIQPNDT